MFCNILSQKKQVITCCFHNVCQRFYKSECKAKQMVYPLTEAAHRRSVNKELVLKKKQGKSYCDASFNETDYYFENGLRKVHPYHYEYIAFCKGRWIGNTVLGMYTREFGIATEKEYAARILKGNVKVNDNIVDLNHELKDGDIVTSLVHRHELPVTDKPLKILHDSNDIVVVDKPASIPVHPCGKYRHNSMIFILAKEHNIKGLYLIHRLDRLTSGLIIFTRTLQRSRDLSLQFRNRGITKTYICRVEGNFPDGRIVCDLPIKRVLETIGISMVNMHGKHASTEFEKLSYNGKSSVLLCRPLTGRMHQIRVHLQYLGYPVLNDSLYNSLDFGPQKGKNGDIGKTVPELMEVLKHTHMYSKWIVKSEEDTFVDESKEEQELHLQHTNRKSYDPMCFFCRHVCKDPEVSDLHMYLHAFQYKGKDWNFETDLPYWAHSHWTES